MSRLVVAFDTASETVALGVARRSGTELEILGSLSVDSPRRANSSLLPLLVRELDRLRLAPDAIEEVVVGRGPGSFTGVRIGVATAKGVAHGLGVPLYGVGSLDAVAWRVRAETDVTQGSLIAIVGDAMRGEVYPALFRVTEQGVVRLTRDVVEKPEVVAAAWAGALEGELLLAGNGLLKYGAVFQHALGSRGVLASHELWAPDGEGLLAAYVEARQQGNAGYGEPATLLPVYTRLSDAEENERKRLGASHEAPGAIGAEDTGDLVGYGADEPRLRTMTGSDLEAVLAIEHTAFTDAWSYGAFASELAAPNRLWLVAADSTAVVGYGGIALLGDEVHVMNLAVAEGSRHMGLGRRLLARLMAEAMDMGAVAFTLEVRESNAAAISLYRSAGLVVTGVRRDYYPDTGEDALILATPLDGAAAASGGGAVGEGPQDGPEERVVQERGEAHGRPAETLVLAIESSCDETAAAVMRGGCEIVASVVASQVDFHARFGGVVPEIASRKHTEAIVGVVDEALAKAGEQLGLQGPLHFAELDAIAVTQGPGLVGALVIGLAYAKGLSFAAGVPLVGVNHLEGHIFANVLADPEVSPPLVALLVSGGHTSLVHMPEWGVYRTLGETLDDAAGEAFDKVAKVLGLGYPGGPVLSRLAETGDPAAIDFPRAMLRSGDYSFSLSGLKTAVINHIRHEGEAGREIDLSDLAASFQAAVIDVQVAKAVRAVKETGARTFCLAGGVAANTALREALRCAIEPLGVHVSVPPLQLCTDNAAMVAAAGHYRFLLGERLGLESDSDPAMRLDAMPA